MKSEVRKSITSHARMRRPKVMTLKTVERARKTIGARLRDSLGRIERVHPELGAHLRTSLRLGTHCEYRPDPPVTWRL